MDDDQYKTFVHKSKLSHARRRKIFKKLYREGKVKRTVVKDGWIYTKTDSHPRWIEAPKQK